MKPAADIAGFFIVRMFSFEIKISINSSGINATAYLR